ncbi:Uma2 family endonuclease [Streptomyces triticagri]|uniref:Uma2 family endonuclease n=1 Tax=Streptomyces triticagri TaxID=2293568 RepID=A0A372M135_9ACTN|nr:Uma2 family endonuclease [Streptomyces triticagri]RFU84529.1 Uma2 family endonuclease [Streptomyces triticagri]
MTALAHKAPEDITPDADLTPTPVLDVDEVLWQAWKTLELPEGYHAEIIEGAIEVSPTGRLTHAQIVNRLRESLVLFLAKSEFQSLQDTNVIHGRKAWTPDVLIAPRDLEPHADEDGLGIKASAVSLVVEVVSPGRECRRRDRERKRREYARAGIPLYVIVDSHDARGTVTVLSDPQPDRADWVGIHRVPFGTEVVLQDGPAKGFAVTEAITGPLAAKPTKASAEK